MRASFVNRRGKKAVLADSVQPVGRLLILLGLVAGSGCEPAAAPVSAPAASQVGATPAAPPLEQTLEFLYRFDEFQPSQARPQVAYELNRWLEAQPALSPIATGNLLERLPKDLKSLPQLTSLARRQFQLEDVEYLQEAVWLRSVSEWVSRQPPPAGLADWLARLETQNQADTARTLATASLLFDWTVRNLQLDALLEYPKAAAGPGTSPAGAPAGLSPPQQGIPGPGYRRLPWQCLLYGHGDAWERARVFILLARQQGLTAVMLALEDEFAVRPRPWLTAVWAGEQLYLFDPQLGLWIPGPDGGIATWEQLRAQPELLRQLDLDAERTYPVKSEQLKRVLVLLEAAPYALAARMAVLEAQLAGERQLVLTTPVMELADRLQTVEGIVGVRIWPAAYEALAYRQALPVLAQANPEIARSLFEEAAMFERLNPLLQGRHQHFRGNFESDEGQVGAKSQYLAARASREVLETLDANPQQQRAMGLVPQEGEREDLFQARVQAMKSLMTRAKEDASYWLGLVQYESGNMSAGIDWFQHRVIEGLPDSRWVQGARYNLARCYEQQGEYDKAREILFVDDSPQQHGNILRARWLVKPVPPEARETTTSE